MLHEELVQFSLLVAEFVRKYLGDGNLIQRVFVYLGDGGHRIWCKHVPRCATNFSPRQSSKWHVDLIVSRQPKGIVGAFVPPPNASPR